MGEHIRSVQQTAALVSQLGPGPWSVAEVHGAGWTTSRIRAAVSAGRLVRPSRGVLALPASGDPYADLLGRVRAALLSAPAGAVVSHATAAGLQGIWIPHRRDALVHLTVPGDHDDLDHGVRLHGSALPPDQVVVLDGVRVTSIPRTAVDVARGRFLADALVPLDCAVRLLVGAVEESSLRDLREREAAVRGARPALWAAYQSVWSWPGTRVVRRALDHLEAGSESPFESRSRGWIIEAGLPRPCVGMRVAGRSGRTYFADFLWEGAGVIGEADGLGKYGGTDHDVQRALAGERHRQRDLEDAGWRVVRWDTREPPSAWVARLRSELTASPPYVLQT